MTKDQYFDAVIRHTTLLERVKRNDSTEFAKVSDAVDKATREILNALKTGELSELNQKELGQLLRDLQDANTAAIAPAIASFEKGLEKLAGYEAGWEARTLSKLVEKELGPDRLKVPNAEMAMRAASARPLSSSGQKLGDYYGQWSRGEVIRINNTVRKGWGEGWTVQELIRTIRGTKAANYKDGLIETTRRNAETIARTSIQHVANTARAKTWEDNADVVLGYQFVATLDTKTSSVCRSLDGRKYELGKGPLPPVHPNCRSTTIAELDPALDIFDEGATRSSMNGYVPADLSYYEWLQTQPEDVQAEAIGPTRAKLLRDGGLTGEEFARLNLGKNFEPLTLAQMQQIDPGAFERAALLPASEGRPPLPAPAPTVTINKAERWEEISGKLDSAYKASRFIESEKYKDEYAKHVAALSDLMKTHGVERDATGEITLKTKDETTLAQFTRLKLARDNARRLQEDIYETLIDNPENLRGQFHDALKVKNPTQIVKGAGWTTIYSDAELFQVRQNLSEATGFFESHVAPELVAPVNGKPVNIIMGLIRSNYDYNANTLNMNIKSEASVYIHELTHKIEFENPKIAEATKAFLKKRAAGGELESMQDLTGNYNYSAFEKGYRDKWVAKGNQVYAGKFYGDNSPATELLTVGIERLYKDPVSFYAQDREYFDFVVKALHNLL
jgi:SPP1 gp7 family putative phage head morphogenesis protein